MKVIARLALSLVSLVALSGAAMAAEGESAASSSGGVEPGVINKVEKAVERGAKATAHGIEKGVKAAGHGIEKGAHAVAHGVEVGAEATARTAKRVSAKVAGSSSETAEKKAE